ncbi:hypothetical protein [Hydrogenophaga sp.]|uniref:hypothetical protein n=1 Tax=Hydrogenophaga sp. TaxID=1904254 RepID=UPI001AC5964D|nr:hypothetical protein [Hydrogenophaga sp.]MBN9369441.1 hypothetical protein [Hydrogenophaga sp.]
MAHSHEHLSASRPSLRQRIDPVLRSGVSRLMAAGLVSALLWAVLLWVMNAS